MRFPLHPLIAASNQRQFSLRVAKMLIAAVVAMTIAGCVDTTSSSYPALGHINDLGPILTPEEREKALADAKKLDVRQSSALAKTVKAQ